ncbi:hydrolase [Clostridium putrefaciens]|uniref:Hydrolase n=1 Tax=Clostridium putrefaciens TaxID=99675 RepID=A0A381JBC0_9CLOT|nr:MBL fold metallo-hydrolase [Clostridium putrefaciens]SUY48299.1 hydrolase [Clostridium putrefaciens]
MLIYWIGYSCFLIQTSKGTNILMDPFEGINVNSLYDICPNIDIVTISHKAFHNSYLDPFKEKSIIIDNTKGFFFKDTEIIGYPSYSDNICGLKRGENIVFKISTEDFSICHLGGLGHVLDESLIKQLGTINVLFVPVGGNITLNGNNACTVALSLKSNIVIPMCYKSSKCLHLSEDASRFIINMKNVSNINHISLLLDQRTLNFRNQVILIKPLQ